MEKCVGLRKKGQTGSIFLKSTVTSRIHEPLGTKVILTVCDPSLSKSLPLFIEFLPHLVVDAAHLSPLDAPDERQELLLGQLGRVRKIIKSPVRNGQLFA